MVVALVGMTTLDRGTAVRMGLGQATTKATVQTLTTTLVVAVLAVLADATVKTTIQVTAAFRTATSTAVCTAVVAVDREPRGVVDQVAQVACVSFGDQVVPSRSRRQRKTQPSPTAATQVTDVKENANGL